MAFTQNPTPTFAKQPRKGLVQILPADTTAQKTVVTAGANGSKVLNLLASSNDTSTRDLTIAIVRSATTYILAVVTIAIGAGTVAGTAIQNLLSATNFPSGFLAVDHDGQTYLNLESGDTLVVSSGTTITAAKTISIHSDYEDF